MDAIDKILGNPYTALLVTIVLGAIAISGKFSATVSQLLLLLALVVTIIGLRTQPWPIILGLGLVVAGILVLLGNVFQPDATEIDLKTNEGVLEAANEPMPSVPSNCKVPLDALAIFVGSNVSWSSRFPHTVIEMADEQMLVINKDSSNKIKVSLLRIFDDRDDIIARIDQDGFWVQNALRKKRPDKSTLIVYDHNDEEVLNLRYLNENAISIRGIFRNPKIKPVYLVVTPNAAVQMPNNNSFSNSCLGEMAADISLTKNGGLAIGRAK